MVADYTKHLLELLTHVKYIPNDEGRNIYTNGIVEPLKMQVELLKPATLEDAMDGTVSCEHLASVMSQVVGLAQPTHRHHCP